MESPETIVPSLRTRKVISMSPEVETDAPQHTDGPHEGPLPSYFVRGKPVCDSACSKIPSSNAAVCTTSNEPAVGPVIIVFITGTIVGLWGYFNRRTAVPGDWGTPGDAKRAGFYLSELTEIREAILVSGDQLDRAIFTPEGNDCRLWVGRDGPNGPPVRIYRPLWKICQCILDAKCQECLPVRDPWKGPIPATRSHPRC
jgi:hypothetical protein